MKIIRKVLVKQVITENSKAELTTTFTKEKMQLEQECQQLLFEQRKLQNKPGASKQSIAQRFQKQIKNRQDKMVSIDFKMEQLAILEIGSEVIEREVEALVEVKEGEHWDEIINEKTILIKDNIVIHIEE